nr:X-linked retinitis pigmentosa GTPase regulator-like isoform X2 [Salvelinus alpinus]
MTGQTEADIPETGAVFTFGKSKFADNVPSKFWLKNDHPEEISCGGDHTAVITGHGRLFMFGSNTWGQLGLGSEINVNINKPTAVKGSGRVYGAGSNQEGQLGLGHCDDTNTFHLLHPFSDHAPIKMLAAGCNTSAALTEDGRLFMWGDNSVGQIGLGTESYASEPRDVMVGQPVAWVSCGYHHSAFVTVDGDLYTFGESGSGRLGVFPDQLTNHRVPQRVESIQDPVIQVSCGGEHTVALTKDNVYAFGRGQHGQLGHGTFLFEVPLPKALDHFRNGRVSHVTCGENHTAVITDSGILYTFGDGRQGKLGLGEENFTNQFRPTLCPRFLKYSVQSVACGGSHMLVLAMPRLPEVEEVVIEEDDVTESILESLETYTELLLMDPSFLMPNPQTTPLWTLSARARRRERESSPEQFGQMFRNLPPLMSGFLNASLPLSRNIRISRTPSEDPCISSLSSNPSSNDPPSPSLSLKSRSKTPLTPSPKFIFPDPPSPSLSSKFSPKKRPSPSKSPKYASKECLTHSQSFKSTHKLIPTPSMSPKPSSVKPTDDNQSPKTLSEGPTTPQTDRTKDTVTEATDSRMLIENLEKNMDLMDEEDNKDMLPDLALPSGGDFGDETGTTSAEQKDKGHKKGRALRRAVKEAEMEVEQALANRKPQLLPHKALTTELLRGSSLSSLKAEGTPPKSPKCLMNPQTPASGKENIALTAEKAGIKVNTSKLTGSNLQSTGKAGSKPISPAKKQSKSSVSKPSTPEHSQIQISVSKPSTPKHGQNKLSESKPSTPKHGQNKLSESKPSTPSKQTV